MWLLTAEKEKVAEELTFLMVSRDEGIGRVKSITYPEVAWRAGFYADFVRVTKITPNPTWYVSHTCHNTEDNATLLIPVDDIKYM